jgi:hypothetical protein
MHIIRINFFWKVTLRQPRHHPHPPQIKGIRCFCMCPSDKKATTYKHIYKMSFFILFRFINKRQEYGLKAEEC